MKLKRMIALALALCTCLLLAVPAFADTPRPYLSYINQGTFDFTVNGTDGDVDADTDVRNCDACGITIEVQQKVDGKWKSYYTIPRKVDDTDIVVGKTIQLMPGYYYRVKFSFFAFENYNAREPLETVVEYSQTEYVAR